MSNILITATVIILRNTFDHISLGSMEQVYTHLICPADLCPASFSESLQLSSRARSVSSHPIILSENMP